MHLNEQGRGIFHNAGELAPASWSAPALWRFATGHVTGSKRQRAAAVQNLAGIRADFESVFIGVHLWLKK